MSQHIEKQREQGAGDRNENQITPRIDTKSANFLNRWIARLIAVAEEKHGAQIPLVALRESALLGKFAGFSKCAK